MKAMSIALAALAACAATAAAQTVVSYSIDGPDLVNIRADVGATYTITAHYSDDSSHPLTAWIGGIASSDSSVLATAPYTATVSTATFAAAGLGTATLSFTDGALPTATKQVSVVDGADVSEPVALDCATETAGPWQHDYPRYLYLGRAADILPACNDQVIVASTAFNRIQAIDLAAGRVLHTWPLRAAPGRMVRVPGTSILFTVLADGTVARLDLQSGDTSYVATTVPVVDLVNFEAAQVLAVADFESASSPLGVAAYAIDASTLAVRESRLPLPAYRTGAPSVEYDPARHVLYERQAGNYDANRYVYDPVAGTFATPVAIRTGRQFLGLSHDGGHVLIGRAWPSLAPDGATNEALADLSGDDLETELGSFDVGTWPQVSVDFRSDGAKLLATDSFSLFEFDVATHKVDAAWTLTMGSCAGGKPAPVRWSPHGQYAMMLASSCYVSSPAQTFSVIGSVQPLEPGAPLPPQSTAGTYTIEGPDVVDVTQTLSSAYTIVAHDGIGSGTPLPAYNLAPEGRMLAGVDDKVVPVDLGYVTLTFAGTSPIVQRIVRVMAGSGPTQALDLDCSGDASDPLLPSRRASVLLWEPVDTVPLCHGQVLAASYDLSRVQAIDATSGTILRDWPLDAAPIAMVRVPGTSDVIVSLESKRLARIDLATGQVDYAAVALPHAAGTLLPFEAGQVLAIASHPISTTGYLGTMSEAYILDAAALTWFAPTWLSNIDPSQGSIVRYDPVQHRLYFWRPITYDIAQASYDAANHSFVFGNVTTGYMPDLGSDFALSPDGSRIAIDMLSATSPPGAMLGELSTVPLGTFIGSYVTGSHPQYRADGARIAVKTGWSIVMYDTSTRDAVAAMSTLGGTCNFGSEPLHWSASYRYVVDARACGARASSIEVTDWAPGDLRVASSVSLSGLTGLSAAGQPVVLNAIVYNSIGVPPTGSFAFTDNGQPIATCSAQPVIGSAASCTVALAAGTHSIAANYSGDALYLPGSSNAFTQTVLATPVAPTVILQPSSNPARDTNTVAYQVSIIGGVGTPTGTVSFTEDGVAIAGCTNLALSFGSTSCTRGGYANGRYAISMHYSGDTYYAASDTTLIEVVNQDTNVALASAGATAIASSQYGPGFPAAAVIDGSRSGANWTHGGGWADATQDQWPDWIEIHFKGRKNIDKVVVYTVQDNIESPVAPTDAMYFHQYGVMDFQVQGWNGVQWENLAIVQGNNLVERTVTFPPYDTDRIRVNVTKGLMGFARITEIEAFGIEGDPVSANWALASNGGYATASSQYGAGFPASALIDGERSGRHWTAGGGWADGTQDTWPDWAEVDFPVDKTIDHVVVYTVQDNIDNPAEPTDGMPFTLYGVVDYTIQGWNGSQWVILGSAAGNGYVKRTVSFMPFTTSRIRVEVTKGKLGFARLTEIEAWGYDAGQVDVALSANGGAATASSEYGPGFPAAGTIDGDRMGAHWTNGGGWASGTAGPWPPWLQVDFNGQKTIDHVVVYALQDDYAHPVEPTDAMTFTKYGIQDFTVEAWDGSQWITLAAVTGNNLVKRTVSFGSYMTRKIRIRVTRALMSFARITEVEAWAAPPTGGDTNVARGATASASSAYGAGYPVAAIVDGDRAGKNWNNGGGWADGTQDSYPDWVQLDLATAKTIDRVTVYSPQDNITSPVEPTDTMTFTQYGLRDFTVQGWDGMQWMTLATVTGNTLVKRAVPFDPFTTNKLRVSVTKGSMGFSRITEIEALGH